MQDSRHGPSLQRKTLRAPFAVPVIALMLFHGTASAAWKSPPFRNAPTFRSRCRARPHLRTRPPSPFPRTF